MSSLADALQRLNQKQALVVHALPMQSKFKKNDDLSVLSAFAEKIPGIEMQLHDPQTAQEAAQIMAGVDLVLAERLHTIVIASIIGKPVFGLSYDVKVRELLATLGMTQYAVNINEPFSGEELCAGLLRLLECRPEVEAHLRERSQALHADLVRYFADLNSHLNQRHPTPTG